MLAYLRDGLLKAMDVFFFFVFFFFFFIRCDGCVD